MDIHLTQNRTNSLDELLKLKPHDHILKKDATGIPLFFDLISTQMELVNNDVANLLEPQGGKMSVFQDFSSSNQEFAFNKKHNEKNNEIEHFSPQHDDSMQAVNNNSLKKETIQKNENAESNKDSTYKQPETNPGDKQPLSDVSNAEDLKTKKEENSEKGRLLTKLHSAYKQLETNPGDKQPLSDVSNAEDLQTEKEENSEKGRLLKNLQEVITEILQKGNMEENHNASNLRELLSSDKKTNIKLKAENIKEMVETVKSDGNINKELLEKLAVLLSEIEKDVKSNVAKNIDMQKVHEGRNVKNQELISKLDKIISLINHNGIKSETPTIISKLRKLSSEEGTKLVETETPVNKSFAAKFSEIEKIKHSNNDLTDIKSSLKSRESIDNAVRTEKDVYSENETNSDSRLTKDRNALDRSNANSDKDIKFDQRFTLSQNDKNSLSGQQQNKNKFTQQSNKFKGDNNKQQRVDMKNHIVNDKTQSASSFESKNSLGRLSTSPRTITHSQVGDSVVRGAKQFLKGGDSKIHLTIKNPDLGNIKIYFVEKSKGRMEVVIVTERPEASELIKQKSAEIRQLLLQEGLDLSKFDVLDHNNKNKGFFSEGNSSKKNNRNNRQSYDDELTKSDETIADGDILNTSKIDAVTGNDQVNVFI